MSTISVDVSSADSALKRAELFLSGMKKKLPGAVSRALNRAVSSGRAEAVREVRKTYTVKAGAIRESMNISLSNRENLEGEITVKGRPRSHSQYRISPRRDTTGNQQRQPRVAVYKNSPLKPLGDFIYKGIVFDRVGKKRLPIEAKYGPGIPTLVKNPSVTSAIQKTMVDTFNKRLDHEVTRALEGESK